jgi:hypothetical protein
LPPGWFQCPERTLRAPGVVSPFVPFSADPTVRPGRHVVTLAAGSAWLAVLLDAAAASICRMSPTMLGMRPFPQRERPWFAAVVGGGVRGDAA